jgi:hypothetical protein
MPVATAKEERGASVLEVLYPAAMASPGERPRYHSGYYAAYVLDPDGNNIEVVDHDRGAAT